MVEISHLSLKKSTNSPSVKTQSNTHFRPTVENKHLGENKLILFSTILSKQEAQYNH